MAWLTARGYFDRLTAWKEHITSAELTHYVSQYDGGEGWFLQSSASADIVITDAELIRRALDGASGSAVMYYGDWWEMRIFLDGSRESHITVRFRADSPAINELVAAGV
jgi:hypothetical protein